MDVLTKPVTKQTIQKLRMREEMEVYPDHDMEMNAMEMDDSSSSHSDSSTPPPFNTNTTPTGTPHPRRSSSSSIQFNRHKSSAKQDTSTVGERVETQSAVGTSRFIAPEVIIAARSGYGMPVDFWAVGVTFYECVMRQKLFPGDTRQEIFKNVQNMQIDFSPLRKYSDSLADLMQGLLCRDVTKRLGARGAYAIKLHPFFNDYATIDWSTLPFTDRAYKPAQYVKLQRGINMDELDDKSDSSIEKYRANSKRARQENKHKYKKGGSRKFGQRSALSMTFEDSIPEISNEDMDISTIMM